MNILCNMNIKRSIKIAIFFIIFCMSVCCGQSSKLGVMGSTINKILFSIRKNSNCNFKNDYYFPEYSWNDSSLCRGKKVISKRKITDTNFPLNGRLFCWDIYFPNPLRIENSSTEFYHKIFIKNCDSYSIYVHSSLDRKWYIRRYNINFEGYQYPNVDKPSAWQEVEEDASNNYSTIKLLVSDSCKINFIDHLVFVVYPQKKHIKNKFIIGDLKIYNYKIIYSKNVYHPFFSLYNDEKYKEKEELDIFTQNYYQSMFPLLNDIKICFKDDSVEKESIIRLFQILLERYPYYNIYGNGKDKEKILNELKTIEQNTSIMGESLFYSLQRMINSMKDPHFKMVKIKVSKNNTPIEEKNRSPIKLYNIHNHIFIAAIIDTTLEKQIKIGMEVLSLNGIPIHNYIDSLSNRYQGDLYSREKKAISHSLSRLNSDTVVIEVCDNNDTTKIQLKYNTKCSTPNRLKNNGYITKSLNQNTLYIRIPSWDQELYTRILNDIEQIKKSKNLILDLRNNPGGGFEDRIASMFINRPEIYCHIRFPWGKGDTILQTFLLKPNKYINLSDKKIIILINGGTVCASELFCEFMREKANAVIIGNERSPGALSHMLSVNLPNGYILQTSLCSKIIMSSGKDIEGIGINPDIWVPIATVNDLAPYQDKVLKLAIYYLKD